MPQTLMPLSLLPLTTSLSITCTQYVHHVQVHTVHHVQVHITYLSITWTLSTAA